MPRSDDYCCEQEFISCEANGEPETCKTVGDLTTEKASALEPLFIRHGVDIYAAGHR